jgi:hypothetical protein
MSVDVNSVFSALQQIFQLLQAIFLTAFKEPVSGLILGGALIALGKAGRALIAAGLIIIAYAALSLILPQIGIKFP